VTVVAPTLAKMNPNIVIRITGKISVKNSAAGLRR
jgi:hypothetical protein